MVDESRILGLRAAGTPRTGNATLRGVRGRRGIQDALVTPKPLATHYHLVSPIRVVRNCVGSARCGLREGPDPASDCSAIQFA